ncbi:MAG: hypothetical protein ACPG46_12080 [Thalassotalea sp.]
MSNRIEPEIPSITPDIDQVRTTPRQSGKAAIASATEKTAAPSSFANKFALSLVYIALAGASYWFYLENAKLKEQQINADQRIEQLEQQLSATGDEMGESTIALKIKLEALTEKSNELWSEMDKLWASAWRKNQSQIKELRSKSLTLTKTVNGNSQHLKNAASMSDVNELQEKQTAADFSLNALSEQLSSTTKLRSDVTALTKQVNSLSQNENSREKQQLEVATSVNQVDTSLQILLERIEQLEAQLKLQANKPLAAGQIN